MSNAAKQKISLIYQRLGNCRFSDKIGSQSSAPNPLYYSERYRFRLFSSYLLEQKKEYEYIPSPILQYGLILPETSCYTRCYSDVFEGTLQHLWAFSLPLERHRAFQEVLDRLFARI